MIRHIFYKIKKRNFSKNLVLISSRTIISQILNIILLPVITRIYLPSEYGVLTVFVAIISILSVSSSLHYNNAIPIAKNNRNAINLVALSLIIVSLFSFSLLIISVFFGPKILQSVDIRVLNNYIYFIPVAVFLIGVYSIFSQWAYRIRDYILISKTSILQSVMSNIVKIALGLIKMGPIGLILGKIINDSAGLVSLSKPLYKDVRLIKLINKKDIKIVARRFINFPLYSAPSDLIFTVSMNLPVLFLTSLFDSSVGGLFGFANGIIGMPIGLISSSFAQVFYAEIAYIGKDNPLEIKRLSMSLLKKLALFGLAPFFIIAILSPFIFSFFFGEKWAAAGSYVQILSVMYYFYFIVLPFGRILEVLEKQRNGLYLNIVRVLIILAVFAVAYYFKLNIYKTLLLFSLGSSLAYILLIFVLFRSLNSQIKKGLTKK